MLFIFVMFGPHGTTELCHLTSSVPHDLSQKLTNQPMGQCCSATCVYTAHKLRTIFIFLNGLGEKNQKNNSML